MAATRKARDRVTGRDRHDLAEAARDRVSAHDRVGSRAAISSSATAIVRGPRPASAVDVPARVAAVDQDKAADPNADDSSIGSGL